MIEKSGNQLIFEKEKELERKIQFYNILKQSQWQLIDNDVFLFYNIYKAYANNSITKSSKFTQNNSYLYFKDKSISFDEAFWYLRSNKTNYSSDLNSTNKANIQSSNVLLPVWKNMLYNEIYEKGIVMNTYISYDKDGIKVTYPAEYKDFYEKWDKQDVL